MRRVTGGQEAEGSSKISSLGRRAGNDRLLDYVLSYSSFQPIELDVKHLDCDLAVS